MSRDSLSLRKIDFDDEYENATIAKLVQLQLKRSFTNKGQIAVIKAEMDKEVQDRQNTIDQTLIEGHGEALVNYETRV